MGCLPKRLVARVTYTKSTMSSTSGHYVRAFSKYVYTKNDGLCLVDVYIQVHNRLVHICMQYSPVDRGCVMFFLMPGDELVYVTFYGGTNMRCTLYSGGILPTLLFEFGFVSVVGYA